MATGYNGVNYAKAIDPSSGNIADPGTLGGKVRVMQDYNAAQVLATADYFIMGNKLPTGAQVLGVTVGCIAGCGSGGFIQVGDEGDPNRYITKLSVSGSNIKVGPNAPEGINYIVTGTTDNYIRVMSGVVGDADAAPLSGGVIKVTVFYTVE